MIPKIIHYCWFGRSPLPDLARRCIASWERYCPGWEIVEWNEDDFDLDLYRYAREAYDARKWAFVSDVVRLYALVEHGGIYMDTDVEVIRPLDPLLEYQAVSGFETDTLVSTGLMGCEKGFPLFQELLDDYTQTRFIRPDGSMDLTTNVIRITDACVAHGLVRNGALQTIDGFTLLPKDRLCPKDYVTGKIELTEDTLTIHHFNGSWLPPEERYRIHLKHRYRTLPGGPYLALFQSVWKYRGARAALGGTARWLRARLRP